MIAWLLLILFVGIFVTGVLLIVPAIDTWRAERKRRRRGGMLP